MDQVTDYFAQKRNPGSRYRVFDPKDPHETNTGPFYWRKRDGQLQFAFRVQEKNCNSGGIVHGGQLMTFADLMMCGFATEGTDDRGVFTVSFNSEFVASGQLGQLIKARAEVVRRTARMAFVRGELYVDGDNGGRDVILTCSGVFRRLRAA